MRGVGNPSGWLRSAIAVLVATLAGGPAGATIRLVDVAAELGVSLLNVHGGAEKEYVVDVNGNGAAFLDYDGDGDLDLLIVNGSTRERAPAGGDPMAALYRNDGTRFVDVTAEAGLAVTGWGMGVCVADVDGDGWRDVYLTAFGPNVLYRGGAGGVFRDATAAAGVGEARWSSSCAFGDYDRDGDLDLYVTNYLRFDENEVPARGVPPLCDFLGHTVFCGPAGLPAELDVLYRNRGDGTFEDVTAAAGVGRIAHYGLGVVFADFNDDGWPDLYVANDSQPNLLYANRGDGTFEEEGLLAGVALNGEAQAQAGMGVAVGDFDADADLDLFVTNFSQDHNTLYRNSAAGLFDDTTFPVGLGGPSMRTLGWATEFVDLDNDGWLDLFVANGHIFEDVGEFGLGSSYLEPNQVFLNEAGSRFRDASGEIGGDLLREHSSRGAAIGDFDNDGDEDVVVVNLNERPTLLRNDGGNEAPFLTVALVGAAGNGDAVGARCLLEGPERVQLAEVLAGSAYLSQGDPRLHFGLGAGPPPRALAVRWPDGRRQRFLKPPPARILRITRPAD